MQWIGIIFPILCLVVVLYAFSEARRTAYGVTPRFYLAVIPYIAFIMLIEVLILTDYNGRIAFLDAVMGTISHDVVQLILLDVFLITGIKYFLTGNNSGKKK